MTQSSSLENINTTIGLLNTKCLINSKNINSLSERFDYTIKIDTAEEGQVATYQSSKWVAVTPSGGAGATGVYTTDNLSVLAATSSAQLAGVISDETGSGALVFATSPTLVTPALGTPASGVLTNCSGTAPLLTAGTAALATTVTVQDTTYATCFIGLVEGATGPLGVKSDGNLSYDAAAGQLKVGGIQVYNSAIIATAHGLTGNVTGNVSGTAATVTGAAQPAITSVGTLTSLAVSGDVLINSGEYLSWGAAGATSIKGNALSNKLQFRTSSTDRMIIKDTGVGIGTNSPINTFHVAVDGAWGGASSSLHSIITSNDGDNGIGIYSGNTKNGYIRFGDTDSQSSGGFNYDHNDDSLKIRTNGTDHIIISSAGKVGIGTTSPDSDLQVKNTTDLARIHINGVSSGYTHSDIRLDATEAIRGAGVYAFNSVNQKTWYWGNCYNASDIFGVCRVSNAAFQESAASNTNIIFYVTPAGACYNVTGTYGMISDERLKSDITTARQYTTDLAKLRVVNYSLTQRAGMNEETGEVEITPLEEPSEKLLGLVAQEVEKVFPAMINTDSNGIKSVKTSVLVPMMLTAIQELTARIEALESV
jgi:hypothetical protein